MERFNQNRLLKLIEIAKAQESQSWIGIAPSAWFDYVAKHTERLDRDSETLARTPVNRDYLYEIALDPEISDLKFSISVLAWGGMRRDHGVRLFHHIDKWIGLVGKIRLGKANREDAYNEFHQLRIKGSLSGMGPAFFTKLIFFGHPNHDGYIMDQWTARSINFLLNSELIKLKQSGRGYAVSDANTVDDYHEFCQALEELTTLIPGFDDHRDTEELLFSSGGRKKGAWRKYLIENC